MTETDVLARLAADTAARVRAGLDVPAVQAFLDRLGAEEGGLVDLAADRGGLTNYGLTRALLWDLSLPSDAPAIRAYTAAGARAVYGVFFIRYGLDRLMIAPRLFNAVADFAVHSGPGPAVRALQRAVEVADDGALGPMTAAAALADGRSVDLVLDRVAASRLALVGRVLSRPDQAGFALGWLRRIGRVLTWRA